jgi:hypothetical protein
MFYLRQTRREVRLPYLFFFFENNHAEYAECEGFSVYLQ